MKNFLFVLFIFISSALIAQNKISGVITDKNGAPIEKVKISIHGTKEHTFTDKNGYYQIAIPLNYNEIEISKDEYRTQRHYIKNETLNISLVAIADINYFDLSMNELLKVKVISASKKEEKILDIPANVIVITREEIEKMGYKSVREILNSVIGLYSIDNRDYWGELFGVRGYYTGFARNIVFQVNGVDQMSNTEDYYVQSFNIPVETIDKIEVIKGPMSIMYGSGAFYGAINIITNDFKNKKATSLVSFSYGSEQTKKVALKYSKRIDNLKFSLNSGISKAYGPDESILKMLTDSTGLYKYGISAANNNLNTGGRLKNKNAYFQISANYNDFFVDFSMMESERDEIHFWPSPDEGLNNRKNLTNFVIGIDKNVSEKLRLKASFNFHRSSYWRDFDYFIKDFYGQEMSNNIQYKAEVNLNYKPNDKVNIITGAIYKTMKGDTKIDLRDVYLLSVGSFYGDIEDVAQFLQIDYNVFQKFKIIAGLRYEKRFSYPISYVSNEVKLRMNSSFASKSELIPRLALIYSFSDKNVLKFLYGKAIKSPPIASVLEEMLFNRYDLKAEYINTYEINYLSQINSKLFFTASVYYNNLNNLITKILEFDNAGNWTPRNSSSGKISTTGIEVLVNYNFLKSFSFEIGWTYQKTTYLQSEIKNIKVGYSPEHLIYSKFVYRVTDDLSISFNGNYTSEMETIWDPAKKNSDGTLGAHIAKKVDGYFLINGNIRYENLFFDGMYCNLNCYNILNTDYLYPLFTSNSGWADKGMFGYSRFFLFSLGYKF